MPKKQDKMDDTTSFVVVLNKPVQVGRKSVIPGPNTILRGDILAALIASDQDAVADYTIVS